MSRQVPGANGLFLWHMSSIYRYLPRYLLGFAFALLWGCLPDNTLPFSTDTPKATEQSPWAGITLTPQLASTVTPKLPSATARLQPRRSPSPSPTPTALECWLEGGQMEKGSVSSDLLPLPLEFRVYLPPCYAELSGHRFPALYLIHGQNYNDDQWDRLGVDEAADRLIAQGQIPPLILVMPRDRSWEQPTVDRFGEALMRDLLPWIDENYRTHPERRYRAIGGLSRGAGWALHLGFSHWESFGGIGMHSLPVFWTDLPYLRDWIDAIPRDRLPRIYMDLGDKDRPQISKSARWFEELLTEKGIPHEWHLYPGYHEEAYWESHVEEYLLWYSRQW